MGRNVMRYHKSSCDIEGPSSGVKHSTGLKALLSLTEA